MKYVQKKWLELKTNGKEQRVSSNHFREINMNQKEEGSSENLLHLMTIAKH